MNEYRQEHLRRKQADAERRKEEAAVEARRSDRRRTAGLLAAIGVVLLALLILAPARFKAIAGEEVDPVKQYLMTHVTDETLNAADASAGQLASIDQVTEVLDPEAAAAAEEAVRAETEVLAANHSAYVEETEAVPAEGEVIEATAEGVYSATDLTGNGAQAADAAAATNAEAPAAIDFASGTFEWDADGDGQTETYSVTANPQGGYVIALVSNGVAVETATDGVATSEAAIADAVSIESIEAATDAEGPYLTVGYLAGANGQQGTQCVIRLVNGSLVAAPAVEAEPVAMQDGTQMQALQAAPEAQPEATDQAAQPEVADAATYDAATDQQVATDIPAAEPVAEPIAEPVAEPAEPEVSAEELFAAALAEEQGNGGILGFAESVSDAGQEQTLTSTDHQILVKYLIADSQFVGPETTIDSLMENENVDLAVIAQFANSLPLLDPGAESDTYVAMIDSSKFSGYGKVVHADFAISNTNGEVLNDVVTYDEASGVVYVPKKLYDENVEIAADNDLPVQAQLLVSYDLDAKGTESAAVSVPVSITSEIPGVAASGVTSVLGYNFDTSVTIPVVAPESAGAINLDNILVYDGGSETPMAITSDNLASYDPETGELTLNVNALSLVTLRVRLVTEDIATQIVDAIAKPTEAQAFSYDSLSKTWGAGNLKNLNVPDAQTAINNKYVYRYEGACLKFTTTFVDRNKTNLENDWIAATKKACDYLYAPYEASGDIRNGLSMDVYLGADLTKYDVQAVSWGNENSGRHFYSKSGDIESGFALPGYADEYNTVGTKLIYGRSKATGNLTSGGLADNLPAFDMAGLKPLVSSSTNKNRVLLVGTGICCHITKNGDKFDNYLKEEFPDNNPDYGSNDDPNDLTQRTLTIKDYVYMRPLYIKYNSNNDAQYIVCGFVDATKGAQQATGLFSFAIEQPGHTTVIKTSSNTGVTNGNGNYANNMTGAKYGIYDTYAKAEAAGVGKAGSPVATVEFKGGTSNGKPQSTAVSLKPGTYWAKEIAVPAGYAANTAVLPGKNGLAIGENENKPFVTSDPPVLGSVTVLKKDDETNNDVKQGEYEFTLYRGDKSVVGAKTAKDTNSVKWDNLPLGNYFVRETKATYPYMTDIMNVGEEKSWHAISVTQSSKDVSVTIKDHQRRGTAILNKIDAETKAGLGGAKFELYSAQDVTSLDGTKRHTKDQQVKVKKTGEGAYSYDPNGTTELVSNAQGVIKVDGLYLNSADTTNFYMIETLPPTGYIADTNKVEFNFKKDESKKVLEITQQKPNIPNGIDIYTKDRRDDSNIANKVMGVWKKEDSVSVDTSAATDAMAIRTPDGSDAYRPTLVPNGEATYDDEEEGNGAADAGNGSETAALAEGQSALVVKSWFTDKAKMVLQEVGNTAADAAITIDDVKTYAIKTGATYNIALYDATGKTKLGDYSGPATLAVKENTAYTINAVVAGSTHKVEIAETATNATAGVATMAASAAAGAATEAAGVATETTKFDSLYFAQDDPRWADKLYGEDTIKTAGSGLCAACHCISICLDEEVNPAMLAAKMQEADPSLSFNFKGNGTAYVPWEQVLRTIYAGQISIESKGYSLDVLKTALKQGHPCVVGIKPNSDTNIKLSDGSFRQATGGAILCVYKTENGKMYVKDSAGTRGGVPACSIEYSEAEWNALIGDKGTNLTTGSIWEFIPASPKASKQASTNQESHTKSSGTVVATWDEAQHAWIAKDLVPGTKYKVVIGTSTVKVVSMSREGGAVHFGRYSDVASELFAKGWLDQSGLAKDDASIVYKGLTDENGYVGFRKIPVGEYVIGEIKPPVDASGHYTYLVDTKAHKFKVNPQTNLIADTDDATKGYHDADAATEVQYKSFLFKEDVTRLRLSKRSTTGGEEEVVGAKLVLTDAEHVVVDEWESEAEPHYIEGLAPGLYWLSEKETPQAYEWAESVQIRLLPSGKVCHAIIYDTPISVGVNVDKRQEIADPLDERVMENGDGLNEAALTVSPEGYYDYSLDVRSASNTWLDELTMTDDLTPATDGMANLVSIETPQAWQDYDGKMNVWYKTNKSANRSTRTTGSGYEVDNGSTTMPKSNSTQSEGTTAPTFEVLGGNPINISDEDAKYITDHKMTIFLGREIGSWPIQPKSGAYQITFRTAEELRAAPSPSFDGENISSDWKIEIESDQMKGQPVTDSIIKITHGDKTYAYTVHYAVAAGNAASTASGDTTASDSDDDEDSKSVTAVSGNATLSDGHVNSWLENGTSALDPDGDKRLEDYAGWELWEEDLPTMSTTRLEVKSLDLADDEYITGIRFEYGRVEAGFTTRPDGWDDDIHKTHDDYDDILNASRMTFEAADASADAAAAQLSSLVDGLASKASRAAEADIADRNASEKTRYEELVASIAEYNAGLTEDSELPRKFIDAIQVPAYAGDDAPGQKIAAAAESAKVSIQAVIETAQTAEGKIALAKALPAMANKVGTLVSDETAQALVQYVTDYVTAVDLADPEGIATATEGIKAAAAQAVDEIAATALAGRVHYAPAIIHMQVTDKYVADCTLRNTASAIAARNGGAAGASDTTGESTTGPEDPEDPEDPEEPEEPGKPSTPNDPDKPETPLLDRVSDTVEQSAKVRVMTLDTNLSAQDGSRVITVENGKLPTADKVHYTGLTIGKEYVIKGEIHVRNGSDGDGIDGGIATNGGQPVTNTVSFVPTAEEGDVLVPFTLDVAELQARPAVAFETLYEGFSGKAGDVVLAEHKDINDPDQTLPVNPAESDIFTGLGADPGIRPSTPLAQTGDPVVIAAIAVIAGGAVIGFIVWRRRHSA